MPASPSFIRRCPSCNVGHGAPNTVGITGNQRTVTYQCSSCTHTWTAPVKLTGALTRFEGLVNVSLEGMTVLVVDDDADFRKSIARILKLAGAEVSVTSTVEDALQQLEDDKWNVVVSDIGMPGLSGYDLIRRARERGHCVPMIAVTGFDTSEHRRQISRHGFAYHLSKPFDPEHLVAVVGETVRTEALRHL